MIRLILAIFLLNFLAAYAIDSSAFLSKASAFLSRGDGGHDNGTKWAVLVAGSAGWTNYRHQADVCHAYQILKNGGLKDENIIVMMYDDIANHPKNPRPGVIINSPKGLDVYRGVPKDYTGDAVNSHNFFNVLLGNKTAIKGGNGKVVNSGPNDHIFIFYTDHGSPLILGMPFEYITASQLNTVLKQKHAMGTYKSMVFYLEACEAGSMFDGLLSKKHNIYVTTASNPFENSYAHYCPDEKSSPPKEYDICLGDLYSIAWMEDTEKHDAATETLHHQYIKAKQRTVGSSHVMEYGDLSIGKEKVSVYIGSNSSKGNVVHEILSEQLSSSVTQRDAHLVHLRETFHRAPKGSQQELEAKKQIFEAMKDRVNVDNRIKMIGELLFPSGNGLEMIKTVRPAGESPVDDWNCFEDLLHIYEEKCGALSVYGRKHTRVFANFCNARIQQGQMEKAAAQACSTYV